MTIAVLPSSTFAADPALLTAAERDVLTTVRGPRRRDEWIRGRLAIRCVLRARTDLANSTFKHDLLSPGELNRQDARTPRHQLSELSSNDDAPANRFSDEDSLASWRLGGSKLFGWVSLGELPVSAEASVLVDPDGAPRVVGMPCNVSLSHDGDWIAVAITDVRTRIGIDLCLRTHAERVARILAWLGARDATSDPVGAWAALEAVLKLRRLPIEALRDRTLELESRGDTIVVRGIGSPVDVQLRHHAELVVGWAQEAA